MIRSLLRIISLLIKAQQNNSYFTYTNQGDENDMIGVSTGGLTTYPYSPCYR